jgi:hypothetical protein
MPQRASVMVSPSISLRPHVDDDAIARRRRVACRCDDVLPVLPADGDECLAAVGVVIGH